LIVRVAAAVLRQAQSPSAPCASGTTSAPTFVDLTAAEKKWLVVHPVIRIGAETNYAPYEFQDSADTSSASSPTISTSSATSSERVSR